ncbi:hypothetical protein FCULG_00011826 [Fusarium culmorum]|uniref:Cystathionine gamma-synthase n=1 Tax=Fusarium culmorum TaxID=5516 RepID=A0A2T4GRU1_FUSCU|nr:hypothetical protein FCULG_00011826 [Fusarium culmorum]
MANILVTSITKSFNRYANAIGGTAILNLASPKYTELKPLFDAQYVPEVHTDDAETIKRNSRNYLARSAKLNSNASAVVEYLHSWAQDLNSSVSQVYYPSVNPSTDNYRRFMHPKTSDFAPRYGYVFSIELNDLETARVFYNNLNVHKSATQFGLKLMQIQISVGLEDIGTLVEDFQVAVEAADKAKNTASE